MILTIRASVAVAVIAGSVAAAAGVTYVTIKSSMITAVSCPAVAQTKPDFPTGPRLPIQGKSY